LPNLLGSTFRPPPTSGSGGPAGPGGGRAQGDHLAQVGEVDVPGDLRHRVAVGDVTAAPPYPQHLPPVLRPRHHLEPVRPHPAHVHTAPAYAFVLVNPRGRSRPAGHSRHGTPLDRHRIARGRAAPGGRAAVPSGQPGPRPGHHRCIWHTRGHRSHPTGKAH